MFDAIKEVLAERRIKRLFKKPPKKATEKDLVDFYNNEIIRLCSTRSMTEGMANFLSKLNVSNPIPIVGKPVIFKTRDPKRNGPLNLNHTVFLFGEIGRTNIPATKADYSKWNNMCQETFGFPLACLANNEGTNLLSEELSDIIKYNDPQLSQSARPLLDMIKVSSNVYWSSIATHFNVNYLVGVYMLYQYSDRLYLSYYFGKEFSTEKLATALKESKELLDRYFAVSKVDKKPKFPIEQSSSLSFQVDPSKKAVIPEKYEVSKEVEDCITNLNLNFTAHEKMVILLKVAQNLVKQKPGAEYFGPVIDRLYKMLQHNDAPFMKSALVIDSNHKILLPDYELEIQMQPLHKAVYILFYHHPEGLILTDLDQHREELTNIYTAVSNRHDPEVIEKTISELLNPASNTINECMSRIREAFLKVVDERIAKLYYISGERGGVKRIVILNQTYENS